MWVAPKATLSGDMTAKASFVFLVNGQVSEVGSCFFSPAGYIEVMSETQKPPCHHEATSLRMKPYVPRDIEQKAIQGP